MKYVFLYVGSEDAWAGMSEAERERKYEEIGRWFETNRQKFANDGEELAPSRTATTVRNRNGKVSVTDGPFIEAKETVGGFSVVDVPDLDAAIALAKTWPGAGVEIRPIIEH